MYVLVGCGAVVLSSQSVGGLGVALAFGLVFTTVSYSIGHVSGCHLNPAVTLGMAVAGRFVWKQVLPYACAQILGALAGASVLYFIASGHEFFNVDMGFAANGYGNLSPRQYNMFSCFLTEFILTFALVLIFVGSTSRRAPSGLSPLAIGFAITVIHLVSLSITGTGVNPARSSSQAIFMGSMALSQLWLFWLAPLMGAIWAGIVSRLLFPE
jgi:aquaporin Z